MFDSIRSVTSSAVGALEYVARQQSSGVRFSVRQWVRSSRRAPAAPRRAVHSVSRRPDRGAALDDLRLDAAGDLRGHGSRRRAISGCGSWSMSSMRSGRSTG